MGGRLATWLFASALPVVLLAPVTRPQDASSANTSTATAKGPFAPAKAFLFGDHEGSRYVELDSWIYPAMLRLVALGYVHSAFVDIRPWTRMECARMIHEAGEVLSVGVASSSSEARSLYNALLGEFRQELDTLDSIRTDPSVRLESTYSVLTGTSGTPLNDSYHFGQTIINNYGRPYEEGFNTYDGYSAYGDVGPFEIYSRGEFQHSPSASAYAPAVRELIARVDDTPLQSATPVANTARFRLLDTYAATTFFGWNVSFGKQSLWWAPNVGGSLLFSDNAEPVYMGRVSSTAPFHLPWILRLLGPAKIDLFLGKLSGNEFPPRPLIHGEKIGFQLTRNLEISFSRTGEFGGVGRALTLGALLNTYFSFGSSVSYGASQNPGERNGGFDFSYRIPGFRNWITLYADLMSRDDPNPLDAPRRASWNPGFYLAWLPYLPRLDFRVEAVNTDPPSSPARNGQFDYWEIYYRDLYTNHGNLIGDWIGREGMGVQAWTTYWLSAKNSLQFAYRHAKVDPRFIPYGETLNDASATLTLWLRKDLQIAATVQYEKWAAPVLASTPQTNFTSSSQITFWPQSLHR
jgi:hypothetical protein